MNSQQPDRPGARNTSSPCCSPDPASLTPLDSPDAPADQPWTVGRVTVGGRPVPRVATTLGWRDRLGSWKVRWGIGRMNYRVPPGLYAVGRPDDASPVLVSANYKMSFDRLRAALGGFDAWLLVIDTKGVNVWCAAGKGTFGSDEIISRIKAVGLETLVAHRKLVVPQLGGSGASARRVRDATGFSVRYGPVRAEDIPAFLQSRMKATASMRRVRFTFGDRLVLIPIELVPATRWAVAAAVVLGLLSGVDGLSYSPDRLIAAGPAAAMAIAIGIWVGTSVPAALLPWIPGRAFAFKGALVGLIYALILSWLAPHLLDSTWAAAGWTLMITAACSYFAMNFTGCSTFTSLSGVLKEMRYALPLQVIGGGLGLVLWIVGRLIAGAP